MLPARARATARHRYCSSSTAAAAAVRASIPRSSSTTKAAAMAPDAAAAADAAPDAAAVDLISSSAMFNGVNRRFRHRSQVLGCDMTFTVFYPPQASTTPPPVLYYLSGLTCTDENAVQKSGAQRAAAARGLALVFPDTSPRPSEGVASFPAEAAASGWDFGYGAGFYLDATKPGWEYWRMETYIMEELPRVLAGPLPAATTRSDDASAAAASSPSLSCPPLDLSRAGVCGHSMGGAGSLALSLKHPAAFRSVSAFAPICAPSKVPWGQKAFRGYFAGGADDPAALQHDACALVRAFPWGKGGPEPPAPLIDTGTSDAFLEKQLLPGELQKAVDETEGCAWREKMTLRMQPGYDHSYFFVATFADDHVEHHAKALLG
jgi:S-formylglutathione hydrolase